MKTDHKNYDDWAVKHDPPPPDPVPDLIYQGSDAAWFAANPQEWTSVVSASTPIGSLLNFNYQGGDIMSGLTQGPEWIKEATTAALNDLAGGEVDGAFRFSTGEIQAAIDQIFDFTGTGFIVGDILAADRAEDLTEVLAFWNSASADETTANPDALPDDVASLILRHAVSNNATDPTSEIGLAGFSGDLMYDGGLLDVLIATYPDHGWTLG